MAQKLKNIPDIKIPYATEGVIRTAQLDDTVSPENSVQLAVNMNFDRVGAAQTRPGVTTYADTIAEVIKNYGTLRNSIVNPGYEKIYQLGGTVNVYNNTFQDPTAVKISDEKISVFWTGIDGDGFCRNVRINQGTGTIEPLGTPLEFDTSSGINPEAIYIGQNGSGNDLVLVTWQGVAGDAFVQCFNVSGDSIVAIDTPLEFDTSDGNNFTLAQIDSTHVICFYTGSTNDGIATVFAINLTTGAVTEPGSPTSFETVFNAANSCVAVGDGTRFINFWYNGTNGLAQTFSVNTGSWAITALSTPLSYDTLAFRSNAFAVGDGNHFVNIFQSTDLGGFAAQSFALNLSTFAITGLGVPVVFGSGNDLTAAQLDDNHFVAFYSTSIGLGFVQILEWNTSTFNFSAVGAPIGGYDFANGGYTTAIKHLEDDIAMVIWGNVDAEEGKAVMFITTGAVVNGRWLYAGHGDEVSNTSDGIWTVRRTGLAEVSKPRFSQFLNYIWMVNGNPQIGGNPVATSNGGNFGTDLVPDNFPPGDFIHAGFEGRVWILNKTLGTVYYTDIVQFTPPSTYSLTYNSEVGVNCTISV